MNISTSLSSKGTPCFRKKRKSSCIIFLGSFDSAIYTLFLFLFAVAIDQYPQTNNNNNNANNYNKDIYNSNNQDTGNAALIHIHANSLNNIQNEAQQEHQQALQDNHLASGSTSHELHSDDESALKAAGIEFRSPMKKILDLISGHSTPIILVSSGDDQPGSSSGPSDDQAAKSSTENQQHYGLSTSPNTINFAGQQWALVPTLGGGLPSDATQNSQAQNAFLAAASSSGYQFNQHFPTTNNNHQNLLAGQQQQLIPSTVSLSPPLAQYLASQQSLIDAQNQPQIAIVPASISFGSLAAMQAAAAASGAVGGEQSPANGFESSVGGSPSYEDRTQPVFLSAYVPESQTHASGSSSTDSTRPNSIQQVQNSIEEPAGDKGKNKPHSSTKSDSSSAEQEPADSSGEDPDKQAGSGNELGEDESENKAPEDIEEPARAQNRNQVSAASGDSTRDQSGDDGEPRGDSGSSSFVDKYDSDKDGAPGPAQPSSSAAAAGEASSSSNQAPTESSKQTDDKHSPSGYTGLQNGLVNVGLNDDCLQCICRASSGCDEQLRCITRGSEDRLCGPFQLTEEYWREAGAPLDGINNAGFSSFEDCANDIDCAVETVTKYMKKNFKDCDGDDNITCMDYARLHRLTSKDCAMTDRLASEHEDYWNKFQQCAEMYNRSRNGDDENI